MHPVAAHTAVAFVPSPERGDHGLERADQPHSPATEAERRWLAPAGDPRRNHIVDGALGLTAMAVVTAFNINRSR